MKPPAPMMRKLTVIALDTPVRDQPVPSVIGCRNTASENIAAGGRFDSTMVEAVSTTSGASSSGLQALFP